MTEVLVLKKQSSLFTVEFEDGKILEVGARNLKKDGIFVGDKVLIDETNSISKVQPRKNIIIRPPVAGIDKMFITVAPIPKPDLLLVDKLIVFCFLNNIKPILCINKFDLDEKTCKNIEKIYKKVIKTLIFCTFDESVEILIKEIKGVCVLAGQSAVGKSSIINALKKETVTRVDTFSKKVQRGKQTTRTVELYKFGKNKYLADTAGFSKLDESLLKINEKELKNYYPEFLKFADKCKYKTCVHKGGKEFCGVQNAVENGLIAKERYENYLKLYDNLKNLKRY